MTTLVVVALIPAYVAVGAALLRFIWRRRPTAFPPGHFGLEINNVDRFFFGLFALLWPVVLGIILLVPPLVGIGSLILRSGHDDQEEVAS